MKNTIKHNEFFQYFSRSQCISDPVPGIWFIKIVKIWQIWLIDYLFLKKIFYTVFKGYFPFTVISKHRLCSPFVQYILENTLYPVGYTCHSPTPYCPCPLPTGNHRLVLCICEFVSFVSFTRLWYFSDSTYQWYHIVHAFLWLISLSIKPSKSIHVAANGKILFFSWLSSIPSCAYIHRIFFIHSSVDGHLGCFHILPIGNITIMNIGVHVPLQISGVGFLNIYIHIGVELLCHIVALLLVFWGASILFSIVAAPIYIPTNRVRGFPFLHILPNICYVPFWW